MNRSFHIFIHLLLSTLLMVGIVGCGAFGDEETAGDDLLRVGVLTDENGLSFYSETTGMYYGMEAELADELAKRMGYSGAEYVDVTIADREGKLLSGNVDLLLAGCSVNEERASMMDFTAPYYSNYVGVLVEYTSLFEEAEDLISMKIGIVRGEDFETLFQKKMEKLGLAKNANGEDAFTLWYADSYEQLINALEVGDVDAVCIDGATFLSYDNGERNFIDLNLGEQFYYAATAKGSELSAPAAEAMQSLLDDGTVHNLIEKWQLD